MSMESIVSWFHIVVITSAVLFLAILTMLQPLLMRLRSIHRTKILPCRVGLGLKERLSSLGLELRRINEPDTPASEKLFRKDYSFGSTPYVCRACDCPVHELTGDKAAVASGSLGIFCGTCGRGELRPHIRRLRADLGLPHLPDGNLFRILNVLERDAAAKGIIKESVPALPETFECHVSGTGDYRYQPLKIRVDVANRTAEAVDGMADESSTKSLPVRLVK